MLFLLKPGVALRLDAFVKAGGALVLTYLSGIVDETNLALRGGWPGGGLRAIAGVWAEEIRFAVPEPAPAHPPGGRQRPRAHGRAPGQRLLRLPARRDRAGAGRVQDRLLRGRAVPHREPARGRAGLLPGDPTGAGRVPRRLRGRAGARAEARPLPGGRVARGGHRAAAVRGGRTFLFVHNLKPVKQDLDLGQARLEDVLAGGPVSGRITLPPYGSRVLRRT